MAGGSATVQLPDGLEAVVGADALIASDQGHSFRHRGRANKPVGGILWIVVGKLSGDGCDFCSDGQYHNSGTGQQILHRSLHSVLGAKNPPRK